MGEEQVCRAHSSSEEQSLPLPDQSWLSDSLDAAAQFEAGAEKMGKGWSRAMGQTPPSGLPTGT